MYTYIPLNGILVAFYFKKGEFIVVYMDARFDEMLIAYQCNTKGYKPEGYCAIFTYSKT